MSGVKGKSGLKKGMSNNPNGRPKGSKNKIQTSIKNKITDYINNDFDTFISEIKQLEIKDRVKAKTELIKLVLPRPVSQEEEAIANTQSLLFSTLFRKNSQEENNPDDQ